MNKIALLAALIASAAVAAPASAAVVVAAPAALVVSSATVGQRVVVQNTGEVVARFESQSADYSDNLLLVGQNGVIFNNKTAAANSTVSLGSFAAGTELVFRLQVVSTGDTFFSGYAGRNADGVAHAAVSAGGGRTFVGFEDIAGGGDRDYNDLVFSVTNTVAAAAVPEPATWGTMLLGLGLAGAGLRRRRGVGLARA